MGFAVFFERRSRAGFLVVIGFLDVLHDQRRGAIGGVEWSIGLAQPLVGKAADLDDLVGAHSIGLHDASGGIGAIGREFPVTVAVGRRVRLGIGVPFDGEFVGQTADFLGEFNEQ